MPAKRLNRGVIYIEKNERKGRDISIRFRDGHLPMCLKKKKRERDYFAVDFGKADLLLIDVLESELDTRQIMYDYYGSVVEVEMIRFEGGTAVYYKVDQLLAPRSRNILGILSRHFLDVREFYYNDICSVDNVVLGTLKAGNKSYRHKIKEIGRLEKTKVSGDHHIHFTAEEVFTCLNKEQKKKAFEALRLPKSVSTSFMAGVMMWLASLDKLLYSMVIESDLLDCKDYKDYCRRAKKLSVRAKGLQNIVIEDLKPLFEADVLSNRAEGQVDWEGEKRNRTRPRLADVSKEDVYKEAVRLFSKEDSGRERPRKMTWEKFWKARWQWSATGSIHSQYDEDREFVSTKRELANKFIALSTMPRYEMGKFLNRKPEVVAWSSIKYEWGKLRAIYGTDVTSYVLTHFAFYNCEDLLPSDFPVGRKARPSFVRARVAATLENVVPFCIDFEDFNSQHSNESMIAVMNAYKDVFSKNLSDEQIQAVRWAIDSVSNTTIRDNMGTGTEYKVAGTLMSGWRLTTFINSVLNYIYTQKMLGKMQTQFRSIHNGDDVLLGCSNMMLAVKAVGESEKNGIRLQRAKCSFGGLAEFLRVDHISGESGQYITRNIATMMHSRIESRPAVRATDVVEAMEERFAEFAVRGGDQKLVSRLRKNYYDRLSVIYNMSTADMYSIKTAHRVTGGISERMDAPVNKTISTISRAQEIELPEDMPGVQDYSEALHDELSLHEKYETVVKHVRKATSKAIQLSRSNQRVEDTTDVQRYQRWKGLYKAHTLDADKALIGKAMMTGMAIDVLSKRPGASAIMRIIAPAPDRMAFLSIVI